MLYAYVFNIIFSILCLFYIFRVFFFSQYSFLLLYTFYFYFILFLTACVLLLYLTKKNIESNFIFFIIFTQSNIFELFFFKFVGLWSTAAGSIFLIYFFLSILLIFFIFFYRAFFFFYVYYILSFLFVLLFFWGGYLLFINNPLVCFLTFKFFSLQLNPLLQDFVLAIHPPILYLGYICFFIVFAYFIFLLRFNLFAVKFVRFGHISIFFSFIFLTFGIFLGSWWAYFELGWGGWWFWDPVENISLLPWLLTVIYLHFISVSTRNSLLVFFISILGVCSGILVLFSFFFVRSGLLFSVHNFINDSNSSLFLLSFCLFLCCFLLFLFLKNLITFLYTFSFKFYFLFFLFFLLIFFSFIFLFFGTFFYSIFIYFFDKVSIFTVTFFNEIFSVFFLSCFLLFFIYLFSFFSEIRLLFFSVYLFLCYLMFFDQMLGRGAFLFTFLFFCIFFYLLFLGWARVKSWFFLLLHFVFFFFGYLIFCYVLYSFDFFSIMHIGDFLFFLKNVLVFNGIFIFNSFNYFSFWGSFYLFDWVFSDILSVFFPHIRFYFFEKILAFKVDILTNFLTDISLYLGDGSLTTGWYIHFFYNFGMPLIWLSFICFIVLLWVYLIFRFFFFKRLDSFFDFYANK